MTTMDREVRRAVREAERAAVEILDGRPQRASGRRRPPRLTAAEYKAMTRRQRRKAARNGLVVPALQPRPGRRVARATRWGVRLLLFALCCVFAGGAGWSALYVGDIRSGGILAGFALLFFAGSMRKRAER